MNSESHPIQLSGLDGSNPLAFLAALGVLRCLDLDGHETRPRLSWADDLSPAIHPGNPLSQSALVESLHQSVQRIAANGAASLGDIIGVPVAEYRRFADPQPPCDSIQLLFASAYGSDAVVDPKKDTIIPTALSFSNGQGGKLLLKDFRTLADRLTIERLHAALFEPWCYDDQDVPTFRWDPLDMRTGAHMATDPGSTETRSVMGANALAFVGLSFLTAVPMPNELRTLALRPVDGETHFVWPLWRHPLNADVVGSLLAQHTFPSHSGIMATFAARRIIYKKNLYLGPSFSI